MTNAMVLNNMSFVEMTNDEMMGIAGGWSAWGVACGVFGVVAGVATVVGGVALCLTPEPTMLTKVGGYAAITAGVATVGAGVTGIMKSDRSHVVL